VAPASIEAQVLGEHGTSQIFHWSGARVGGSRSRMRLDNAALRTTTTFHAAIENEVRYANITIIEGIGASQYGIGMVCARIAEMVLRDERAVVPIGVYNSRLGVTLSLPESSAGRAASRSSTLFYRMTSALACRNALRHCESPGTEFADLAANSLSPFNFVDPVP